MNFKKLILIILANLAIAAVISAVFIVLRSFGILQGNLAQIITMGVISSFGMAFFSLFISKWMAKKTFNLQMLENPQNQAEYWLDNTISRLARQANIQKPEIGIYVSQEVNAFATGASKDKSLVAVSTGIMNKMSSDELEAVLAHEISHIKNGDMVGMTLVQGAAHFVSFILAYFITSALSGRNNGEERPLFFNVVFFATNAILSIFASIFVMYYSRQREFSADLGSGQMVGKRKMIAALEKLKHNTEITMPNEMKAFGINGGDVRGLFRTHPTLEDRIEKLKLSNSN